MILTSFILASGDFEAQVVFDNLVAVGKGRKKLDVKMKLENLY